MDINEKFNVIDKFLKECFEKGNSDVICPVCKTRLKIDYNKSCYTVRCQTQNCLSETFRGI